MTYPEVLQSEQIQSMRPQIEAANLNFESVVSDAYFKANARQYVAKSNPDKSEIISFVVDFIWKLIDAEMQKPAKKKIGVFTRLVWGFLGLIGAKQKAKDQIGKI